MDEPMEQGESNEVRHGIQQFVEGLQSKEALEWLIEAARERYERFEKEQQQQALREFEEFMQRKGLDKGQVLQLLGCAPVGGAPLLPEPGGEVKVPPMMVKRLKELAPHGLYNSQATPSERRWGDPEKERWRMPRWLELELHQLRLSRHRVRDEDLLALIRRFPNP
ncbi:MAG: hypothetical protein HQL51_02660 [Magnetococcales bacterium]|nr:hypothetical protein [Magnetococcales bacterium]